MRAIVVHGPKIQQQPIEKITMRAFPFPADLKLKKGISLTSK
jgi:hypothetical protein